MTSKDKQTKQDKASDVSKKPYRAPQLTTFGTVAQATEGGTGQNPDVLGGSI